jgi:thiamine-phosphate pyrophosphorylase
MKVHLISSLGGASDADLVRLLEVVREAGPDFFQVREKELSDRRLADLTQRIRADLPRSTSVLVNGRPDIAVATGAQGVQLPSDGLPAADVRKAFPSPFLIGVSCHSIAELFRAADDGADFALLSPIYEPKSKPSRFPALGPHVFDELSAPPLPVYALGGIDSARVASWPAARRRKVAGVAGISLLNGPRAIDTLRAIPGSLDP